MANWKLRYAELLDQHEKQQQRYRKKFELLIAALASSAQLAKGVDEAADVKLRALQGLLRQQNLKNVDLEPAVKALAKQMTVSVGARTKSQKSIMSSFRQLSTQTRSMTGVGTTVQALKQLEQDFKSSTSQFEDLPVFFSRFSALHKSAVSQGKKKQDQPIWRRWLSSAVPFSANELSANELSANELSEADLPTTELSTTAPDLAKEPMSADNQQNETGPTANDTGQKKVSAKVNIRRVLSDEFTLLLQQLGCPEDVAVTERLLAAQFSAHQIPDIVSAVCEHTTRTIDLDRKDFRSSLDRFEHRLTESKYCISSCQTLEEGNIESDESMHAVMQNGMAEIQSCVAGIDDIEQIKVAVNNRVAEMAQALEKHKNHGQQSDISTSLSALAQHVAHMEDMTQAASLRLDIQHNNSACDAVTGLPNRLAFQKQGLEIMQSWRRQKNPLCIAVCKIDAYALLVERHDCCQVDEVLKTVAGIYQKLPGAQAKVFRISTDEFAIFLINTDPQQAWQLLESARQDVAAQVFQWDKVKLSVRSSIGLAGFKGSDSVESAFARAARAGAGQASRNKTSLAPDQAG
ncbi:MAG: GGDEF domain-containing protein [Pseudomonadales bacterium]|nr:GGDEF domain-containing protein [Pseudomonadales bacterium]